MKQELLNLKSWLLMMCLLVGVGNAWADETVDGNYTASCEVTVEADSEPDEYVFRFAANGSNSDSGTAWSKTSTLDKVFDGGYQYISSISATNNVYPARNSLVYGVKFGTQSAAGSISFTLKKPVKATYIVVSAAPYGDSEGQTGFTINGQEVSMKNGKNKVYEEYVVKLDGSDLSTITLTQKQAKNGRIYVEYIKLVKDDAYYAKKSLTLVAQGMMPTSGTDMGGGACPGFFATFSSNKDVFIPMLDDSYEFMTSVYTVFTDGEDVLLEPAESVFVDEDEETGLPGYYVPKFHGVLLFVTPEEDVNDITISYYEIENVKVPSLSSDNMLRAATTTKETDDSYKFYMLAYSDSDMRPESLGFYYGANDGVAFESREGTAYLAVPADAALAKGFRFVADDATAIKNVDSKVKTNAVYNLAGQRVSTKGFKGIVIKNGKKMLNK